MLTTDMTFSARCPSVRGMGARVWVDESIHVDARPGGIYVLAAAISHEHLNLDEIRHHLRGLVPGRRRRLHWHAEDDRTRSQIFVESRGPKLDGHDRDLMSCQLQLASVGAGRAWWSSAARNG